MAYWLALNSRGIGRGFLLTSGSFNTLQDAQEAALNLFGRQLNDAPGNGNLSIYDDHAIPRLSAALSIPQGWTIADFVDKASYNAQGGPFTASQYQAAYAAEARPTETTVGGPYLPDTDLDLSVVSGIGGSVVCTVIEAADAQNAGAVLTGANRWQWRYYGASQSPPEFGAAQGPTYSFVPPTVGQAVVVECADLLDETDGATATIPATHPAPSVSCNWGQSYPTQNPIQGEDTVADADLEFIVDLPAGAQWEQDGGTLRGLQVATASIADFAGTLSSTGYVPIFNGPSEAGNPSTNIWAGPDGCSGLFSRLVVAAWNSTTLAGPPAQVGYQESAGGPFAAGAARLYPIWQVQAVAIYTDGQSSAPDLCFPGTFIQPAMPAVAATSATSNRDGCGNVAVPTGPYAVPNARGVEFGVQGETLRLKFYGDWNGLLPEIGVGIGFKPADYDPGTGNLDSQVLSALTGSPCLQLGVGLGIGRKGVAVGPYLGFGPGGQYKIPLSL